MWANITLLCVKPSADDTKELIMISYVINGFGFIDSHVLIFQQKMEKVRSSHKSNFFTYSWWLPPS